jgi:hypothetical protein
MVRAKNTMMTVDDEAVGAANLQRSRLARECANLDKREEQALAEEGYADPPSPVVKLPPHA